MVELNNEVLKVLWTLFQLIQCQAEPSFANLFIPIKTYVYIKIGLAVT